MQDLLASDLPGIIIQTIGAIIVAIITKKVVDGKGKNDDKKQQLEEGQQRKAQNYSGWIITGVVAAVTFVIFGLAYDIFTPEPTIEITSPKNRESIEVRIAETGSGSFLVDGNSTRVIDNPRLRILILVHPADPFAEGWWIQPAVVMNSDGTWSGQAWIGDPNFPPNVGNLVDILVIVADPEQVQGQTKVSDPKDLNPVVQSSVVRFSIKSTK
jgi:hypothetical protein